MTVFSSSSTNPIIPSTNNYIRIILSNDNNDITLTYPESFVPRKDYMAPFIEVSQATGFTAGSIKFDDIALTSFGNGCIISNIGAQSFKVYDFGGTEIQTIAAGQQFVFFIGKAVGTDAPTWRIFQLGTGTSEADAYLLAGLGLSVYQNKLNSTVPSQNKNISVIIDNTVSSNLINWTGGNTTIDLFPSLINIAGFYFYFRNSSTTNGIVTFSPKDGSTIDGETSLLLNQGQSAIIILDVDSETETSNWKTVGLGLFGSSSGGRITSNGIQVINGTAADPSYSFIDSANLGFYAASSSQVGFTSGGNQIVGFDHQGINLVGEKSYSINDDNIFFLARLFP